MILKYVIEGYKGTEKDPNFTLEKEYVVIGIDFYSSDEPKVHIEGESDGTPILVPLKYFQVIDPSVPPNYTFRVYEYGFTGLQPAEFDGDFWELYHDGDEQAEKLFLEVMNRIRKFHDWSNNDNSQMHIQHDQ